MTAVAFDTLKFVRALREKAKLSPEQAEGFADAIAEAIQNDLATKADIQGVTADIEALRLATKADIQGVIAGIEALRLATKADIQGVIAGIEALRLATKADIEALRLATKTDIEALRLATKADIEALKATTKADIAEAKADIIKWMFGTIGFQTLIILGAVLALVRVIGPAS